MVAAGVAAVTLLAAACSSSGSGGNAGGATSGAATTGAATSGAATTAGGGGGGGSSSGKAPSVVFMVPGTLGDLGFFDSAQSGMVKAQKDLGAKTKTVEGGNNATSTWLSDLQNLSNGKYDVVVTGSDQVSDQLTQAAKQHPKQKYIMFDQDVNLPNVASITYEQNDGAFLAGVLAALVSQDTKDFPLSKNGHNVGIVGGINIPVINDFIVGFKKGVQVVNPADKIQVSYVGSFTDSQTGYNQAASMYASGADVVFAAAGGAGLGVLKASRDKNKYSIGVDSNQNGLYPKNVIASDLKNVGTSVYDLLNLDKQGKLTYGKDYVYGIKNNGVALLLNNSLVPASVSAQIKSYTDKVASGAIKVPCVNPYCSSTG
jgi:basic membrane protein A